jgi:hypothetical protein
LENFKIVNKTTGMTVFLNEKEKETFFGINGYFDKEGQWKYDIYNLTKAKDKRINKMLDVVAHLCVVGASILATLIYIQNY